MSVVEERDDFMLKEEDNSYAKDRYVQEAAKLLQSITHSSSFTPGSPESFAVLLASGFRKTKAKMIAVEKKGRVSRTNIPIEKDKLKKIAEHFHCSIEGYDINPSNLKNLNERDVGRIHELKTLYDDAVRRYSKWWRIQSVLGGKTRNRRNRRTKRRRTRQRK